MPGERPGDLRRRARRAGVLRGYRDLEGRWRTPSSETLTRIVPVLEAPPARRSSSSPHEGRAARDDAVPFPPVTVVRGDAPRRRIVSLVVPPRSGAVRGFWRSEGTSRWRALPAPRQGRFVLPSPLPFGCHELRIDHAGGSHVSRLVVAPDRLRPRGPPRRWGIFAPVYALRDEGTWGCGDLTAFERLGEWAASLGASVLATLPLLATFLDRPLEPSPYRPVSRRFWNELYLDPRRTPEFRRSGAARRLVRSSSFRRQVAVLEGRRYVAFRAAARLKRAVLERMLRSFDRAPSARRAEFRRYVTRTAGLEEYAAFRASLQRDRAQATRYHLFVQWLVDEQLRQVASRLRTRGVDLYFDLPLGVDPRGFDAQRDAALFVPSISTGSPPDPGVPLGQDWGFAPWHPGRLRDAGYRPWIEALARHFEVARILRIDHALGLHRLFWIPREEPPSGGAYVRFPAEELYATLVAEAARAGAEVVGEDLGTVPPELRSALRRNGLLRIFVAQLEWDGPRGVRAPPTDCVASLNTHDHPPFAAYWKDQRARRSPERDRASRLLFGRPEPDAFREATNLLARSSARLLLVNLEDLWGERRPQNVPGRSGSRMFSRRFRFDLATLRRNRAWSELLSSIDSLRRRAPRGR